MKRFYFLLLVILVGFSSSATAQSSIEFSLKTTIDFTTVMEAKAVDIDKDGDMDVIAASSAPQIKVFYNDGYFNFREEIIATDFNGRSIGYGDLNKDGNIDIIASSVDLNKISYWLNNGTSFTEVVLDDNFAGAHTVHIIDIDKDNDNDIICAGFDYKNHNGEVAVWYNDGGMTFSKHLVTERFETSTYVDAGDIDKDGLTDLVACGEALDDLCWYKAKGDGSFEEVIIDTNYYRPHTVLLNDYDQDGDLDIMSTSWYGGDLSIWDNDGAGSFVKTTIDVVGGALWFDAVDLDLDGDKDLFGTGSSGAYWYENTGNSFGKVTLSGGHRDGFCMISEDLDGDGDFDLMATSRTDGKIYIWLNSFYQANFESEKRQGHVPFKVNFKDVSNQQDDVIAWKWDFNNDGIIDSELQNPEYTFQDTGKYSVKLIAETASRIDTISIYDFIRVFNGETSLAFTYREGYVKIPASDEIVIGDQFTIEFFLFPYKKGKSAVGSTIFQKGDIKIILLGSVFGSTPKNSLVIELKDEEGNEHKFATNTNMYSLWEWQHFAFTYNIQMGEPKIYKNGNEQEVININGMVISENIAANDTSDIYIGKNELLENGLEGAIDELRIWNNVRTESEIREGVLDYVSSSSGGLQLYMNFNEADGDTVSSLTGNDFGHVQAANYTYGIDFGVVTDIESESEIISSFTLNQNYPNPFNPSTQIQFFLPETNLTTFKIYNNLGQVVSENQLGELGIGSHSVTFNGENLASGVYYYQILSGSNSQTRKMILMK